MIIYQCVYFIYCHTPANCGEAPPIDNGSVSAPVTLDGATATYHCNYGYENLGDFTKRKCQNGIWSREVIICTIMGEYVVFKIVQGSVCCI